MGDAFIPQNSELSLFRSNENEHPVTGFSFMHAQLKKGFLGSFKYVYPEIVFEVYPDFSGSIALSILNGGNYAVFFFGFEKADHMCY